MKIPFIGKKKLGDIVIESPPKPKIVKPKDLSGLERLRLRNQEMAKRRNMSY